jgi:hypothetical protein
MIEAAFGVKKIEVFCDNQSINQTGEKDLI